MVVVPLFECAQQQLNLASLWLMFENCDVANDAKNLRLGFWVIRTDIEMSLLFLLCDDLNTPTAYKLRAN